MGAGWGGGIIPERKPGGDGFYYFLGALFGIGAGWLDIKIGDLLLTAVGLRDYTLVQGITVVFVVGFLLINLAVEVLFRLINPRLR